MGSLTQLTTSVQTLYTVTAPKTKAVTKQILVANTGTSTASVTIHLVPASGTATLSNKIVPEVSISANSVITLDITQILTVGESIQALASASSINVVISGYEVE
jgi:hypothetical protein